MKKILLSSGSIVLFIVCFCIFRAITGSKMHDFEGKCVMCHTTMPDKDTTTRDLLFVDEIDRLCDKCHTINKQKSHPINVRPNKDIPLKAHLDKNGLLTCTSCHDVHKEDKTSIDSELSGLMWGHVKGRAFCALCHNKEALASDWRHQTALPYAHANGKLLQAPAGARLDKFSTECLSCHDGTLSKTPQVEVTQGVWQHGSGQESHPIGVEYPRSGDFQYPESLPGEIRLFDGKVGCLSCHEMYSKENNKLALNNNRSRLCFSCHKK
jgi:predicted CXXCH cytochrome family protein